MGGGVVGVNPSNLSDTAAIATEPTALGIRWPERLGPSWKTHGATGISPVDLQAGRAYARPSG